MQKFVNLLLLVVCAATACKQAVPSYLDLIDNDWKKDKLKGRVKKVVATYYYMSGAPYQQCVTEYNERGFIVGKVLKSLKPDENLTTNSVYGYDTILNITSVSWLATDTTGQWEKSYYNQQGKLVHFVTGLKGSEDVSMERTYTYDEKDRLLEERRFVWGEMASMNRKEYLADGSKKTTCYDKPYTKRSETIENDTVEIEKRYDAGPPTSLIKKDAAGNLIYTEERNANNTIKNYCHFYYNRYNDRSMTIYYNSDNKKLDTTTISYTYDKFGNYTSVDYHTKREITYW